MRKRREGVTHPDRNAQFEPINQTADEYPTSGGPVISVDTKKKELPKLHHTTFQKLCAAGIVDITDVPTDFKLNGLQQRGGCPAGS